MRRPGGSAPTLGLQLRARISQRRLERELAAGRGCDDAPARALRAAQLATPESRRQLAGSLRRVADLGNHRDALICSTVRPRVGPWRDALIGLAERLEQPAAVSVCGIARARQLLTDGTGPLYSPVSGSSLGEAVWWVADGMELDDLTVRPA